MRALVAVAAAALRRVQVLRGAVEVLRLVQPLVRLVAVVVVAEERRGRQQGAWSLGDHYLGRVLHHS